MRMRAPVRPGRLAPMAILVSALLLPSVLVAAPVQDPTPESEDLLGLYARLRAATVSSAGHITAGMLVIDRARFHLEDGELYLVEPVAGQTTGAVFIGRGRLTLYPPDAVERQQLSKYTDAEEIDERFDRAVFRFTGDVGERLQALATPTRRADTKKASDLYRDRHKKMFDDRLLNPDSRILLDIAASARGTGAPGSSGGYFLAEIDGKDLDWFTMEVEPERREEVMLYEPHGLRRIRDVWTSFHVRSDYGDGPTRNAAIPRLEGWQPAIRIPHTRVDLAVDGGGKVHAVATVTVEAVRPLDTVRLSISTLLSVTDVRLIDALGLEQADDALPGRAADPRSPVAPTGASVPFVQERNGRGLNEDLWEPSVTVLLPATITAQDRFILEIAYEGDLLERRRANGDFAHRDTEMWFPRYPSSDRTAYDLVFRTPEKYVIATGGDSVGEEIVDGTRVSRWTVPHPARGISFYCGELRVADHEVENAPPVTVYTSRNSTGLAPGNREKTVRDIASAIRLFSEYFGPYPYRSLRVSETPSSAGQSFPGFILLSYQAFGGMHTGEAEFFRAHEVAHQWWGASIGWGSYRGQWMSEGFAQYAAALYSLYGLEDADQFDDMLDAWSKDILGRGDIGQRLGMRHYGFGPEALRKSEGFESGPVWIGYRLASDRTPVDYRLIVYEKGAFVLHMLRSMMLDPDSGDDTTFRDLMYRFAMRHRDSDASTEDFLAAVNDAFGEPMDWFFDQWVYGTAVPTYEPELRFVRRDERWTLAGHVLQRDVPEGFRMPVPVRVTFEDGTERTYRIDVDAPRVDVDIELPGRPDEFEFNAGFAVLAKVD